VAYVESSRRVGRSQAVSIFWGLVSVCFAAAACYYYWNNHENETSANVLRDQVLTLQEERDSLSAQKDKLQSSISDSETQLKTREDFLQEKETRLAEEETRLEALDQKTQADAQAQAAQADVMKKFNETARKLAQNDADVIVREGRPVLRVPDSALFAFGDAALKPEGKSLLNQIAGALNGQAGNFELRIETFTDVGELRPPQESAPVNLTGKPDPTAKNAPAKTPLPLTPPPDRTTWDLTGARAAAIARYFHDEGSLPFRSVVVVPRSDTDPIEANSTEGHARNRRTEITLVPAPAPFHGNDAAVPGGPVTADQVAPKPASTHIHKSKTEKTEKAEKTAKTDKTAPTDKGTKPPQ
jgi:flagellar motor protein MotB